MRQGDLRRPKFVHGGLLRYVSVRTRLRPLVRVPVPRGRRNEHKLLHPAARRDGRQPGRRQPDHPRRGQGPELHRRRHGDLHRSGGSVRRLQSRGSYRKRRRDRARIERSQRLQTDSLPHPLTVSCHFNDCAFGYDGATALDGDGTGFNMLLEDVQAGKAYAFLIELPVGQTATQVSATFYQAGAAAGSSGFKPVASGPLGDWMATLPGHQSWAEQQGCNNGDRFCISNFPASFGIRPGGAFRRFLKGTWVATASGAVLLRLVMNCDVTFYADTQANGCRINTDGSYSCQPTADDTNNGNCASELRLTVTPDAYYDEQPDDGPTGGSARGAAAAAQQQPVSGTAKRTDTIVLARAEVEAQGLVFWQNTPTEQRMLVAAPTVDEMLVSGSEANALLTSMFSQQQEPHVIYPLTIQLDDDTGGTGGGGHRRTQRTGGDLRVQILAHAPTLAEAKAAVQGIMARSGAHIVAGPTKGRRRAQEQTDTVLRLEAALSEERRDTIKRWQSWRSGTRWWSSCGRSSERCAARPSNELHCWAVPVRW